MRQNLIKRILCATLALILTVYLLPLTISLKMSAVGGTVLNAGDIVILEFNGYSSEDGFTFMPLVSLTAGTTIHFTDYGWNATTGQFHPWEEGNTSGGGGNMITYTAPTNITAGTLIRQDKLDVGGSAFTENTEYAALNFNHLNNINSFNATLAGHDGLLVFQGSVTNPRFIWGFQTGQWGKGSDTDYYWSDLPSALSNGTNAIFFADNTDWSDPTADYGFYKGSTSAATAAEWRARVADSVNWTTGSDITPTFLYPNTFTVTSTGDTTAPTLSSTSATDVTSSGATLNFTSDEAGTYYYLVYAAADSAPDAATVKVQGTAITKGTDAATASANTVGVTGLSASTAYKAYIIVEDASGNASAVSTVEITTQANGVTETLFVDADGKSGGANDVVVLSDGKYLTAGSVCDSDSYSIFDMTIVRYNANGTIDTTFGIDGRTVIDTESNEDNGIKIIVQSDGKIVVASGTKGTGGNDNPFAMIRLTSSGVLDTSFGTSGIVSTDIGAILEADTTDTLHAIVSDSEGNIYLAGNVLFNGGGSHKDFAVLKYSSEGVLDTTFGTNGVKVVDFDGTGTGYHYCTSAVFDKNEKLILAGSAYISGEYYSAFARMDTDGVLDTTFGTNGLFVTQSVGTYPTVSGLILQPGTDKVIAVGYYSDSGMVSTFITNLTDAGALSDTIYTRFHENSGSDQPFTSVCDDSGNIYITGMAGTTDNKYQYSVIKVKADLSGLDTSFGTSGKVMYGFGPYDQDYSNGIAIDPNNKIAVVGYTQTTDVRYDEAFIRLNTDGSIDTLGGTVIPVPLISGISPESGTISGGTSVVITGTNFTGATSVLFGSTNAASFTVNSATQITAASPAHSAGTVDVRVITSGGTSVKIEADRFSYSEEVADTTSPMVADKTISSSNLTHNSVTLSWNKATDDTSAQTVLQYLVYQSSSNNLTTVSDIEENGTAIGIYTADIATKDITGLTAETTYYYNVIVKDQAGNKTCYTTKSVTTSEAPDTTVPTVADKTIVSSNLTYNSVTLSWNKATDNMSPQTALQYLVYWSSSNNLGTVSDIETNGNAMNSYTADISSININGLDYDTTYYFNVIVKDEAGNKTCYTTKSVTTNKPVLGGTVTISGTIAYGSNVSVVTTGLSSTPECSMGELSYQWTRDGFAITGATASTYSVVADDIGKVLNVTVTAANCTGSVNSANATATVKGDPSYTVPTGLTATYGDTLSDVTLPTGFTWEDSSTTPVGDPGDRTFTVTFTPENTDCYKIVTGISVTIAVQKCAATVTVAPTASAITYGQSLADSELSGGTAGVAGVFTWTDNTIKPSVSDSGVTAYSVTFTPTDTTHYNIETTQTTLTVNKATPTVITPPNASAILYGQTLSFSILTGGTIGVSGVFTWTDNTIKPSVSDSGTTTYSVTFTPTDTANYNTTTTTVTLTVNKATPSVTQRPAASAITYGQTLSDSVLSGGTGTVPGSFSWTNGATAPAVSDSDLTEYSVTFTPTDTVNYNTTTAAVKLIVNKATPAVTTAPNASSITYGQTLASSILTGGTIGISGVFSWTDGTIKPSVSDSDTTAYSVTFTPTDTANYNTTTTTVTLVICKATPIVITKPDTSSITYGETLADCNLSGGNAGISGVFTWTDDKIKPSVSDSGVTAYTVTFTPTDTANYNTATTTVTLIVNKATPSITERPVATAIAYGQTLSDSTLSGGTVGISGTFAWTDGTIKPAVSDSNSTEYSVTFTPTDTVNYNQTTTTVTLAVNKTTPTVTVKPDASAITYGQSLADSLLSNGTASVAGVFAWMDNTIKPSVSDSGKTSYFVTFTPTDTANYATVTTSIQLTVNKANPAYTAPTDLKATYGQKLSAVSLPSGFTWESDLTAYVGNVGSHDMTVAFTPEDTENYNSVTGISVTLTVSKANTSVTLTVDFLSESSAQITAIVTGPGGIPTGSMTFKDGTAAITAVSLTNGTAVFTWTNIPAGDHTIIAEYSGSENYNGSTDTFAGLNIVAPPSAEASRNSLSADKTTVTLGQTITLTATGDFQNTTGTSLNKERYVPVSWTSSEAAKSGSFTYSNGLYTSTYTPSTAGTYTVTASFQWEIYNGSVWIAVTGTVDTKTIAITVSEKATSNPGAPAGSISATIGMNDINSGNDITTVLGNVQVTAPSSVCKNMLGSDTSSTLKLTLIKTSDTTLRLIKGSLGMGNPVIISYELTLEKVYPDGKTEQIHSFGEKIKVTFNLTSDQINAIKDQSKARLYWYDSSTGKLTDMKAEFDFNAKTATFYTDHFSAFLIAEVTSPTTGSDTEAPNMGISGFDYKFSILIAAVSIIVALSIVVYKKKHKEIGEC